MKTGALQEHPRSLPGGWRWVRLGEVATYRIVRKLPNELRGQLPTPEQIAALLEKA